MLGCGALCVLIALCFAELSSKYDRSGGPYVYACDAFGRHVGFGVGWLGMATGVLGLAAVAVGFGGALERFVHLPRAPVAVAVIVALGAINWAGVKAGGWTSTLLSIVKIAPLALVALAEDGHLPHRLRQMRPAIAASTAFAAALAIVLGYARLVDVSNVVILSGYALTCLAAFVLGSRKLLALVACGAALALLVSAKPRPAEFGFAAALLAAGFVFRAITPHR